MLDFIEFLDSKYAERGAPGGILAKVTEAVEDTMRAGKLPDPGDQRHDGPHGQRREGHEGPRGGGAGGGGRGGEGGGDCLEAVGEHLAAAEPKQLPESRSGT